MRVQNKNKRKLHYATQSGRVPKYERNADGTIKYITVGGVQVPVETGETEIGYATPIEFFGNIAFSGGETQAVDFGTDTSKYDATICLEQGSVEMPENTLIWYQSEIGWLDVEETVPDPKTADYRVTKITPSLNQMKYLLARIQK